jgi:hypothetical protein
VVRECSMVVFFPFPGAFVASDHPGCVCCIQLFSSINEMICSSPACSRKTKCLRVLEGEGLPRAMCLSLNSKLLSY